jgi:Anthrax toxin LF subunit
MKTNIDHACRITGFVVRHARACESVAKSVNCIILFREPGKMAHGLIAENYCMKGFRIDTKSCNWGPMSGFVCADPRLTKDAVYEGRNKVWTQEALSGHIVEKFFGKVEDKDWVADVMPIAISKGRISELIQMKIINPKVVDGQYVGESALGGVKLSWRLVPAINAYNWWLTDRGMAMNDYYVLCINKNVPQPFNQQYPSGVEPIKFRGHETILGLINPGTKKRGFKACVTADYDLFSVWNGKGQDDRMGIQHNISNAILNRAGNANTPLSGGVARMESVDQRLQSGGHREHHRFGDVSARIMNVKALLNTALQTVGQYKGGNAIHHNDEAGNFALAKGTLKDCLPLIGFLPGTTNPETVLIEDLADFKELVLYARANNYQEIAKPEWLTMAGV